MRRVALLAEGVDRNVRDQLCWLRDVVVALLAEGVDRNYVVHFDFDPIIGRPPRGGRG